MNDDAAIILAFFKFWDKWNNDTDILDGSDVYDGKYSLIDNGDLADLEDLGNEIDKLIGQ